MTTNRPLHVFLCHSKNDIKAVRELYERLRAEPWIEPWLDEENLYPGQDWNMEIEKAVEAADTIIVCLTKNSINKEGYVQRELRIVLDIADYKPEGTLYIMPVRLEECEPPRRLRPWQYADYFEGQRERGLQRLLVSLKRRAESLGLIVEVPAPNKEEKTIEGKKPIQETPVAKAKSRIKPVEKKFVIETYKSAQVVKSPVGQIANPTYENKIILSNSMEFMYIPAGEFLMGAAEESKRTDSQDGYPQHTVDISYDYWMARYPVTNELYNAYVKFKGINHPVSVWEKKKDHPVTYVKWTDTIEYCQWLNNLFKGELSSNLVLRLPTESEWEKSARGQHGNEYPWGNDFDENKCNTYEGNINNTTPVGLYSPLGDSPYGCADMAGNVWEWTYTLNKEYPFKYIVEDQQTYVARVVRGGSFDHNFASARCAVRGRPYPNYEWYPNGFRVCIAPPLPE